MNYATKATGGGGGVTIPNGVGYVVEVAPQVFAVQTTPLPAADLGAGPSATKFLRGDQTWALPSSGGISVYDRAFNAVIANTVVETAIYSASVPGNTLGPTQKFRLTVLGKITDTSSAGGSADTFTVRCKFGATTLIIFAQGTSGDDFTAVHRAIGADQPYKLVFELQNLNAAGAQVGSLVLNSRVPDLVTGFYLGVVVPNIPVANAGAGNAIPLEQLTALRGTAAIDTTAAATLAITGQWSIAQATKSFTAESVLVELL